MLAISDKKAVTGRALMLYFIVLSMVLFVDVKTTLLKPSRAFLSYMTYPVSLVSAAPDKLFNQVDEFLENEPNIEFAYQHLHAEYVKLKAEMLKNNAVENENRLLREFFDVANRSSLNMQLARPLQIDLDPYQHRVIINKGVKDGVYLGQAVLDEDGVVGQVTDVFRVSSVVTLITDPAHTIPVRVQRSGLHALIEGTGNFKELRVPFLNKNVDFVSGDILETSGLGGRFPAGYPVAIVDSVSSDNVDSFLKVDAVPVAAVNSLRYVLLVSVEASQAAKQKVVEK